MDAARPPDEHPAEPAPQDDALEHADPGERRDDPAPAAFVGTAAEPPLGVAGIPGRTRPLFEELPPGPPTWPGWTAIVVGTLALLPGLLVVGYAMGPSSPELERVLPDPATAGIAALVGTLLVLGGLVWLVLAGIIRRRVLGPDRYRGPSVIALLVLVVVGGNLVAVPILLLLLHGNLDRLSDPFVVTVELLLTPATFLAVYGLFIALPRALPGVRIWKGMESLRALALGVGIGLLTWIGMGLLSALVNLIVTGITGNPLGGEQAVAGLAQEVPLAVAVLTIAVLAPFAEELFFRGAVLNAWEREYGTGRAILGSAVVFAIVHIAGGTALAIVQVFLLGLLLAWVYVRTRSLATTMGLHGAFNLASVLALFLAAH